MKKVVSLIAAAGLTAAAILGAVLSGGSGFWFASAAASVLCCIPFFLSFEKRAPSRRRACAHCGNDRIFCRRKIYFRACSIFQAGFRDSRPCSTSPRTSGGIHDRSTLRCYLQHLVRSGTLDAFPDALLGSHRSRCRDPRKTRLDKQTASAVHFRNRFRNRLLVHHGRVDGSFNERQFLRELWIAAIISAAPVTAVYCVSNVVFLLALNKPLGKSLNV